MTTPDEHRRNLAWTIPTLRDVVDASKAGSLLRLRALQLLDLAPSIEQIEKLDAATPERVTAAIDSIEAAREFFLSALRELDGPEVCRSLQVTLRHCPGPRDFALWRLLATRGAPMGGVMLRTADPLRG